MHKSRCAKHLWGYGLFGSLVEPRLNFVWTSLKPFKSFESKFFRIGCALRFHQAPKAKEIPVVANCMLAVVLMWPCCDPVACVHSYVTKVSACMAVLGSDVSWANTPFMAYIWSGCWSLRPRLPFALHPPAWLCKRDQCNTAEAAVAGHGWWMLRLRSWNVGLDREAGWTIRIVLFLDLETVFFGTVKLKIAANPLNWNPCFLLDSSCIQHILGEKSISLCKGQFISALAMLFQ